MNRFKPHNSPTSRRLVCQLLSALSLYPSWFPNVVYAKDLNMSGGDKNQKKSFAFLNSNDSDFVKFSMPDLSRVTLAGTINDVPVSIILDSGVGKLGLDKTFAAKLGLIPQKGTTAIGVSGTTDAEMAGGVRVVVGGLTLQIPETVLFDASGFQGTAAGPVVAILGRDVFDNLIVDVNFQNETLLFSDPKGRAAVQAGEVVPLTTGAFDRRQLPISIEDAPASQALFDLGASRALYVSAAYAQQIGLMASRKTSTTLSIGVEGASVSQVAVLKNCQIGSVKFTNIPIEVPQAWNLDVPIIVGMPLLRRLHLQVNFPSNQLGISPNQPALNEPFRKDRSGMSAKRMSDRLQVTYIAAGSPAATAGLTVGDEIVAIDGQKLDSAYFKANPRAGSQPAGTIYNFSLASGKNIRVVLADYF